MLGVGHYISLGITLLIFCLLGLISIKMVKSLSDYLMGGRKLGPLLVAGGIVGGFVGGTVTIGTAQMAYRYGISGIWFTLGAGAACLQLFLFLARPLREKEVDTVSQFLALTYGSKAVPWVALFVGAGMFIQVSVQMVAAAPMLTAILPVSTEAALLIFAALTVFYVLGGGIWGSSLVGLLKLVLLSATLLAAAVSGWALTGGGSSLAGHFDLYPWFSIFPRGFSRDLAGGLSAVIGFISTQACIQPVFAGRDVKSARAGTLTAAILIPLFGAAGVLVGMYMRMAQPGIDAAMALPLFMLEHLPPLVSGAGLATLLVTLVLSSSAMALGVSTLFSQDIYPRIRPGRPPGERLMAARATVFVTILAGTVMAYRIMGDLILDWSYLSNALRGVTVFAPLLAAVFFGRRIPPAAGVLAVSAAPVFAVAWKLFSPGTIHPLYAGLPVSILIILSGIICPRLYTAFQRDDKKMQH